MILELQGILYLNTPKGEGRAAFLIDYGPESDLYWTVILPSGELWTVCNTEVTVVENWTLGRKRCE